MKLDNETLAMAAIVAALLLYWGTKKDETEDAIQRKRDEDQLGLILKQLTQMEKEYDTLPGISDRDTDTPLEGWIEAKLNKMATELNSMSVEL